MRSVTFLGHIISSEGIEVNLENTEAVKNCPSPWTPTNIRSFLGLAGYYRKVCGLFASIVSPLTTFTQKSVKLELSEACDRRV